MLGKNSKSKNRNKNTLELELVKDLLKQKKRYERYFRGLDNIDNSALSAYTGLVKTAAELWRKMKQEEKGAGDSEELRQIARQILESEYGINRG